MVYNNSKKKEQKIWKNDLNRKRKLKNVGAFGSTEIHAYYLRTFVQHIIQCNKSPFYKH